MQMILCQGEAALLHLIESNQISFIVIIAGGYNGIKNCWDAHTIQKTNGHFRHVLIVSFGLNAFGL